MLLDFGLAKDFPPTFRDGIVRLTFSILTANRDGIIKAFQELGFRTRNGNPDTLLAFADLFLGSTIKQKKAYADKDLIEQFNEELPRAIRANPVVEVPADVLLVGRMMGLLSGLGKSLDSQVDLFTTIMPYAQRLMMAQPVAASDTLIRCCRRSLPPANSPFTCSPVSSRAGSWHCLPSGFSMRSPTDV